MTKFIAVLALMAVSTALGVGAMWYGYGVALKSGTALVWFTLAQAAIYAVTSAVTKED